MAYIVITHANSDTSIAREVATKLTDAGFDARLASEARQVPQEDQRAIVQRLIRNSHACIALFSSESVRQRGPHQLELNIALDVLKEIPGDQIFLIPVKIDFCELPYSVRDYHALELGDPNAIPRLNQALRTIPTLNESSKVIKVNVEDGVNVADSSIRTENMQHGSSGLTDKNRSSPKTDDPEFNPLINDKKKHNQSAPVFADERLNPSSGTSINQDDPPTMTSEKISDVTFNDPPDSYQSPIFINEPLPGTRISRPINVIRGRTLTPVLGVDVIAEEISGLLRTVNNEPGNMFGIFGKWGRGKTFFMNRVWEILSKSPRNNFVGRIDFHAWKYQDTPASWAYLYEAVMDAYLGDGEGIKGKYRRLVQAIKINVTKYGVWPIVFTVSFVTFWAIWYFFLSIEVKLGLALSLFGSIVTYIGLGITISTIFFYTRSKSQAISLFEQYSNLVRFSDFLGLQAEIQKELIIILKTWIPEKEVGQKRLMLFVDDIDRCSENRIIAIIDSLRVLLDDEDIYRRLVIVAAVDDRVLRRAIIWKYSKLINLKQKLLDNGSEDTEKLDAKKLVREYMDKLFLIGINLRALNETEKEDFFESLTKKRNVVDNREQKDPVDDKDKPQLSAPLNINEADKTDNEMVRDNIMGIGDSIAAANTEEDTEIPGQQLPAGTAEYELSSREYSILRSALAELAEATPRQIRIFYYRYLLARNLLDRQSENPSEVEDLKQEYTIKFVAEQLVTRCNSSGLSIPNEENNADSRIDSELCDKIKNIIELVVAY